MDQLNKIIMSEFHDGVLLDLKPLLMQFQTLNRQYDENAELIRLESEVQEFIKKFNQNRSSYKQDFISTISEMVTHFQCTIIYYKILRSPAQNERERKTMVEMLKVNNRSLEKLEESLPPS
jgi:hypothetical protein